MTQPHQPDAPASERRSLAGASSWCRGRAPAFGLLLLPALCLAGCGPKDSMPQVYQVTGSVAYKGGKPFTGGSVQFTPVSDTTLSVTGTIEPDGSFTLSTIKGAAKVSGAPEGEYRVTILLPIPQDQKVSPPIVLPKTLRVKPQDNQLQIEVPAPASKP
jgi:hypothetical protein